MSLAEHLQNALDEMETASRSIRAARAKPVSVESLHKWLSGLTDYVFALGDLHELDREHIDGSLHEVSERIGLERMTSHRPRRSRASGAR